MLERYFVMPETVDRIRSYWLGEPIERYVIWMSERGFASRTVCRRVPLLIRFGDFARQRGASALEELPSYVEHFVTDCLAERAVRQSEQRRHSSAKELRGPIEQMLGVVLSDFEARAAAGGEPVPRPGSRLLRLPTH